MRMVMLGMVGLVAAAVLILSGGTPAGAACAGTGSVTKAVAAGGDVFVGTVVSTTNHDLWATFAVEEVWSGDVADTQLVEGGALRPPDPPGHFSSVEDERSYEPGARYLVAGDRSTMGRSEPGVIQDSGCSATARWSDELAASRPAGARMVARTAPILVVGRIPDPAHHATFLGADRRLQLLLGVALLLVSIALAALWWRSPSLRPAVPAPPTP